MSINFEKYKYYYKMGFYTEVMVAMLLNRGFLTEKEYHLIVDEQGD